LTAVFSTQIEVDHEGVAWIGGTKVKVTEVVLDKIAHGWSPEETHLEHSNLSLVQVYAALTYYYENQTRLATQIRDRLEAVEKLAPSVSDADFRRKLLDLNRSA
jgi:uncharacterized protein (DUF433 family)